MAEPTTHPPAAAATPYTRLLWDAATPVPSPGLPEHHPWPRGGYVDLRVYSDALGCEGLNFSIGELRPGESLEHHRHDVGEEIYVLLEGSCQIRLDEEVREAQPLEAFRIPASVYRSVYNHSAAPCRWIFIGCPRVYGKTFY
jgi:quercetin dioxygenase-like cupin family protein